MIIGIITIHANIWIRWSLCSQPSVRLEYLVVLILAHYSGSVSMLIVQGRSLWCPCSRGTYLCGWHLLLGLVNPCYTEFILGVTQYLWPQWHKFYEPYFYRLVVGLSLLFQKSLALQISELCFSYWVNLLEQCLWHCPLRLCASVSAQLYSKDVNTFATLGNGSIMKGKT